MKLFTYKLPFFGRIEAINLIAICEHLLLSKVSVSENREYRNTRRGRRPNNDDAITTTTTTTTKRFLHPFSLNRFYSLAGSGSLSLTAIASLAIQFCWHQSKAILPAVSEAFEHDCRLIEQWDSDTLKEDLAIYKARRQKILAFLMDKMEDPNAHDITRLLLPQPGHRTLPCNFPVSVLRVCFR